MYSLLPLFKSRHSSFLKERSPQKPKVDEAGFTLIEMLAAISLIALVLGLGSSLFLFGQKYYAQQKRALDQQYLARMSLEMISGELFSAQRILQVEARRLTLVNETGNKVVYRQGGDTLCRDFYPNPSSSFRDTTHSLAYPVTDLSFESIGEKGVKIRLTLGQGEKAFTLQTGASMRSDPAP